MAPMDLPKRKDLLRHRLLADISEMQEKPYPGITLHIQDEDALSRACLILTPPENDPIHLTVAFSASYPLEPPKITIQSLVHHPNVFDDYICASILNSDEGYTSAYTLKGICIQILSFFSSDTVEQMDAEGGATVDRVAWQQQADRELQDFLAANPRISMDTGYECKRCGFGKAQSASSSRQLSPTNPSQDVVMNDILPPYATPKPDAIVGLTDLPPEVLLLVCDRLEEEDILCAAKAWDGFGSVMRQYNIIHVREMQCFTLKKGFNETTLGVGVHVQGREIQSEFDLISMEAVFSLGVVRSVQGLDFQNWLPLPISQRHWAFRAKAHVYDALNTIGQRANISEPPVSILFSFLNDVVVRLCREASEEKPSIPSSRDRRQRFLYGKDHETKSTLTHASEKAIESYFHLYHLLLCIVIDNPAIATNANTTIKSFLDGNRNKQSVPNLGHLLIMVLISDHDVTEDLIKAIIKEAVTRNVVWMLDARGSNMPELSFLEADAASDYRLSQTFQASKTSYRLLMFAKLMQRCVASTSFFTDPATGTHVRKPIEQRCKDLFDRHGAPPTGAAASLAEQVRQIQRVNDFPNFLKAMEIQRIPKKDEFTKWLRGTLSESVDKGYSKWALTQQEALVLRMAKEPGVGVPEGMEEAYSVRRGHTFFPQDKSGPAGGRGGRGYRGGGRGGRNARGGRGRGGWRG